MIVFRFECDAPGCEKSQQFPLSMVSRYRSGHRGTTFFDCSLAMNRNAGWRVEGNGLALPDWNCKVFCRGHVHLHRDYKG